MLVKLENLSKSIGGKELFEDLSFVINEGEKVGMIGRNGMGKTSIFRIISGEDDEYDGQVEIRKGVRIVLTRQEHHFVENISALDYVLDSIPKFRELQTKITLYEKEGEEKISLEDYCDALNDFSILDYYSIESRVIQSFSGFQLDEEKILRPLQDLSGGEKRFVELIKVMYSDADLVLIDEPTNHMDYIGKEQFIKWLQDIDKTIIVITHDRDVLKFVDKVIEIKDRRSYTYNGNYEDYINQNNANNVANIKQYENDIRALEKAKRQMKYAQLRKHAAKVTKSRTSARIREERFTKQFEKLNNELKKPSLWIDKQSLDSVSSKVMRSYSKYKEQNINIRGTNSDGVKKLLVDVKKLSLGYDRPLFKEITFDIHTGDTIFIKGRNGAGKSSFLKTIISMSKNESSSTKIFRGELKLSSTLKIGIYEQEIDKKYLNLTLSQAIINLHSENEIELGHQKLINILKSYLFDPEVDGKLTMDKLSGGQKARFQLIKMFINQPNLLILDEPTNHLDLPSIEELETALQEYSGGIIYVSHDTYFIDSMGGKTIEIKC